MSEIIRDVVLIIVAVTTGAGIVLGRSRAKSAAHTDLHGRQRQNLRPSDVACSDRTASDQLQTDADVIEQTKTPLPGIRPLSMAMAVSLLGACSVASMIALAVLGDTPTTDNGTSPGAVEIGRQKTAGAVLRSNPRDDVVRLANYLTSVGSGSGSGSNQVRSWPDGNAPQMSPKPSLPGVETMIARLAARLNSSPADAEGWRMLGWSYFHTKRFAKAVAAYERAVKLKPNSQEYRSALSAAKRQMQLASHNQGVVKKPVRPDRARGPTAEDMAAADKMSATDRQAMIENMVAGLAARLKDSPRDPEGWLRLVRSRVVLNQIPAARAALARAMKAFADEPDTRQNLINEVRKLGIAIDDDP